MGCQSRQQREVYYVVVPTNDWKLTKLTDSVDRIRRLLKRYKKEHYILYGPDIERNVVQKAIKRSGGRGGVIVYYGHGCKCGGSLYGNYRQPLFDLDNAGLFKNKTAYVVACHSSRCLGKKAIKKGSIGYLGYNDILWIPSPTGSGYRVIDCIHEGLRMIVKGFGASEARRAVYNAYATVVRDLRRQGNLTIPVFLQINMEHLTLD